MATSLVARALYYLQPRRHSTVHRISNRLDASHQEKFLIRFGLLATPVSMEESTLRAHIEIMRFAAQRSEETPLLPGCCCAQSSHEPDSRPQLWLEYRLDLTALQYSCVIRSRQVEKWISMHFRLFTAHIWRNRSIRK